MIRGILSLLYISCALLTLTLAQQQFYCSCEERAGRNVYEHTKELFPTPSINNYQLSGLAVTDAEDLVSSIMKVGDVRKYLEESDTKEISKEIVRTNSKILDLERTVDGLVVLKRNLLEEIVGLKTSLVTLIRDDLGLLLGTCTNSVGSLSCIDPILSVTSARSKLRYLENVLGNIDIKIRRKNELLGLHRNYLSIVDGLLDISRDADNTCLLGGIVCLRGVSLQKLLSRTVYPLLGVVTQKVNSIQVTTSALLGSLGAELDANIDLFNDRSVLDDCDDMTRELFFYTYGSQEKLIAPAFDDIGVTISGLLSGIGVNVKLPLLQYLLHQTTLVLAPYRLSDDSTFVCNRINHENDAREQCTVKGRIVSNPGALLDIGISIGDRGIQIAAGLLRDYSHAFFSGITGCLHTTSELHSFNKGTGDVTINVACNKNQHEKIAKLYTVNDVPSEKIPNGIKQDVVTNTVTKKAIDVLSTIDTASLKDLEYEVQICQNAITEGLQNVEDIKELLSDETAQPATAEQLLSDDESTTQTAILETTDTLEIVDIVKDAFLTCRNDEIEEDRETIENLRLSGEQADIQVAINKQHIIQNKIDSIKNSGDKTKVSACKKSHPVLVDQFKSAVRISTFYEEVCESFGARIDKKVLDLQKIKALIDENIKSLKKGVVKSADTLRTHLALLGDDNTALVTDIIQKLYSPAESILVAWDSLGRFNEDFFYVDVSIECDELDDVPEKAELHQSIISAALKLVLGIPDISCEELDDEDDEDSDILDDEDDEDSTLRGTKDWTLYGAKNWGLHGTKGSTYKWPRHGTYDWSLLDEDDDDEDEDDEDDVDDEDEDDEDEDEDDVDEDDDSTLEDEDDEDDEDSDILDDEDGTFDWSLHDTKDSTSYNWPGHGTIDWSLLDDEDDDDEDDDDEDDDDEDDDDEDDDDEEDDDWSILDGPKEWNVHGAKDWTITKDWTIKDAKDWTLKDWTFLDDDDEDDDDEDEDDEDEDDEDDDWSILDGPKEWNVHGAKDWTLKGAKDWTHYGIKHSSYKWSVNDNDDEDDEDDEIDEDEDDEDDEDEDDEDDDSTLDDEDDDDSTTTLKTYRAVIGCSKKSP